MLLEGSSATLRLDGDGRLFLRNHGDNAESEVKYRWRDRAFGGDCVFRLQRHIVRHLIAGGPLCNGGRDYLTNIRIEQAIYASDASGASVSVGC